MIGDIQKGKSVTGVVMYHDKKIRNGSASLLANNTFSVDDSAVEIIGAFQDVFDMNVNVSTTLLHVSINPPEIEMNSIDDGMLRRIAERYIEEMGYSNTPSVVYRHDDSSRPHLHLLMSRVDYDGNVIKGSNDFYQNMTTLRLLEKEFGLSPPKDRDRSTNVSFGEAYVDAAGKLEKLNKRKMEKALHGVLKRSGSLTDFENGLKEQGIYMRKLIDKTGRPYLVYGMEMEGTTRYFKQQQLHKDNELQCLDERFEGRREARSFSNKEQRTYLARMVKRAAQQSSSFQQMERFLEGNGIRVEYSSNASGPYGIRFGAIDQEHTFKGSELDKDLAYTKLQARFSEKETVIGGPMAQDGVGEGLTSDKAVGDVGKTVERETDGWEQDRAIQPFKRRKRKRGLNR